MDKFGKSQPVRRLEDQRFLTGQGGYIDDISPDGALHAVFVRSQVAHGTLSPMDLDEARDMPGVHLAMAAEDLDAMGIDVRVMQHAMSTPPEAIYVLLPEELRDYRIVWDADAEVQE